MRPELWLKNAKAQAELQSRALGVAGAGRNRYFPARRRGRVVEGAPLLREYGS